MLDNTEPQWKNTETMRSRIADSKFFEEKTPEARYGLWQGRRIIGRDSPINGGVYLGGSAREAIVVDDIKQPEIGDTYRQLLGTIGRRGEDYKKMVLRDVYDLTRHAIPYDSQVVEQVVAKLIPGPEPDQKIGLSSFIIAKGGECRHQALLAGYLLEKLKSDNYLQGTPSVDRNFVPGKGGHAWVRYVNSAGNIVIIDPAQDFIGGIEDVGKDQWYYERPGEKPRPPLVTKAKNYLKSNFFKKD
ncbi:MAG: hypothetical protein ACR2LN_06795 [Candidatus Levyibacteriota bacterium]